jgi:hypothetical protein
LIITKAKLNTIQILYLTRLLGKAAVRPEKWQETTTGLALAKIKKLAVIIYLI